MKAQRSFMKKAIDFAFDGLVETSVRLDNGKVIVLIVYLSDTETQTISLVLHGYKQGLWCPLETFNTEDKNSAKGMITKWTQEEK